MTTYENRMLKDWLIAKKLVNKFVFKVIKYLELNSPNESITKNFAKLIQENTVNDEFLIDIAKESSLDLKKIKSYFVTQAQPTTDNSRKGQFGEILHAQILKEFHGYIIPFKKSQYKFTKEPSPTGTDIVAFKIKEGKIIELCYAETKLRLSVDYNAISDAYSQILQSRKEHINSVLKFILKEFFKQKHEFYESLTDYGIKITPKDKFRIGAIFEKNMWKEIYLEKLNEIILRSNFDLTVDVVKINDLEKLINNSYMELEK